MKMEKKLQKLYRSYYNSLTKHNLWQAHYQILKIIFLKEFVKLSVRTPISTVLNTQTLKMVYWDSNVYVAVKKLRKGFMKT